MNAYQPVPLPSTWEETLEKSALNSTALRELACVIHTGEILVDRFSGKKQLISKMDSLQVISQYYFAHSYHLALSVYHLCSEGFGIASFILVRALIEAAIDFAYLWLCKKINGRNSDERKAWGSYGNVLRYNIGRRWDELQLHREKLNLPKLNPLTLLDNDRAKKFRGEAESFEPEFKRKHWAKVSALDARARAVDNTEVLYKKTGIVLESVYVLCYKWTSEIVHGQSASAQSYISETDRGLTIDFGPNQKDVDVAIAMANEVLITIFFLVDHLNRLGVDIGEQIMFSAGKA